MDLTNARTYRHPREDVLVSLARLESALLGHENGVPVRVGAPPLLGGGMTHADAWNLRVALEELRAQLEEQADQADTTAKIGGVDLVEAVRSGLISIGWGPKGKAILAALGSDPDPEPEPAPEVDREVLGDLAADLAEAVAARILDRMHAGPTGIQPSTNYTVEEALELAVRHHGHQGTAPRTITSTAREFLAFLSGRDLPITVEDLEPLVSLTSTPVDDRGHEWHLSMEHAIAALVGQAERGSADAK